MITPPPRRRVVAAPARRPPTELRSVRVIFEPDPDADVLMAVSAEADVLLVGTVQTLMSVGLAGIESDAEKAYLEELAAAEWSVLRGVLKAVGVSTEQLPLEVDHKWIEWRM